MTVKNVFSQLEQLFGRNSEAYLIQLMNDGLMDIANKKQSYLVSALTDLEKVEILDTNNRYIMIPKLTDPHTLLRADTDTSNDELK